VHGEVLFYASDGLIVNLSEDLSILKRMFLGYPAVHIHSGAQHIHDAETFRLPERQVASTMISVLILL